ncbi:MAG: molybdopterin-dependent oxidoreductase [Vicinamibacterales bacterium]
MPRTSSSSPTSADRRHHRTCSLCEAMCGITIDVQGDQIVGIRGDDDDPLSRGHICPKAPALAGLHTDPDRLRVPMRRTATGWQEVSWDAALDEAAGRLHEIQRAHGRDAVAAYLGNPNVHNTGALLYGPQLLRSLGTRHRYSATSVDQLPHMLAAYWMFGHQLLLPIPDLDRTDFVLILGANPAVSNGSLMSAPGVGRRLKAVRARGGRVVLVDPRRTETAALADEHLFIRPGTDALLLAAILRTILHEGLGRASALDEMMRGRERLADLFAPFTTALAATATGIPADRIEGLAREFAAAPRAICYGRMGLSVQRFGGSCNWMLNLLNILTGNLDREGGVMFPEPAFDIVAGLGALGRGSFGRWRSTARGLPEFGGELPVAALAEDILHDSAPIRALLTVAGNPVLSTPNGAKLERALSRLDFVVSVDPYLNATTRHAHLVLPPTGPLEHSHYDVVFHALAVRNTSKYAPALFPPSSTARHDWEILGGIEARLLKARGAPLRDRAGVAFRLRMRPERILDVGLRLGPYGIRGPRRLGITGLSLAKLRRAPHGIDLGPLRPCLRERLPPRRDGPRGIDLVPEAFAEDLRRLAGGSDALADGELVLIGRRQLRNNNSWMHNVPALAKGKPRCTLLIHPHDADARGIADGQEVDVESRVGLIRVPVKLDAGIMPGVVSLPHGFGHDREGVRLGVARALGGASLNDLTDDAAIDPVSGNAVLSGVPVHVRA